jgi:hypothetical protein
MLEVDLLQSRHPERAVYVEPCEDGIPAKTRVRAVVRDENGVRETTRVFDTLDEALAYAHGLYPVD